MVAFVAQRIGYGIAVLIGVTSVVFGLLQLSGDPIDALVPPGSSPAQIERLRHHFGLDRSLPVQYVTFLSHAARGDFGDSWTARRPALTAVLARLPKTLELTAAAIALATMLGVSVGVASGIRPGGLVDAALTTVALLGQAVPGFWLGTLLILFFAVRVHWFPSSGGGGGLSALVLPALTLALFPMSTIARLLRSSLVETMHQDYIRTAAGKGLSPAIIVVRHALKNAALPTLSFIGLQVGILLGGAVVVEGVFAYPGIGQLALQAVSSRDLPTVQAFVVVVAAMIILAGFAVDVVAHWIDPRLRSSPSRGERW